METWLLELIQCPITREPLSLADAELLQVLHPLLNESKLLNRQGVTVDEPFEAGLVNASRTWFYPVIQGIPTLVPDEAIPLPQ